MRSEELLKAFFIVKKCRDGRLEYYYSAKGNYSSEQILAENGFTSWQHVQDGKPGQFPGFVTVQMRPPAPIVLREDGSTYHIDVDFDTPFNKWKFALRHQPWELPGWAHVGEIKAACVRLLPAWAERHLARGRLTVRAGQFVAAMQGAHIIQAGGSVLGYKNSMVFQQKGSCCVTRLYDRSVGEIHTLARAHDRSRAEIFPGGQVEAFGDACLILHPGPDGELGRFTAHSDRVQVYVDRNGLQPVSFEVVPELGPYQPKPGWMLNAPFNMAVE